MELISRAELVSLPEVILICPTRSRRFWSIRLIRSASSWVSSGIREGGMFTDLVRSPLLMDSAESVNRLILAENLLEKSHPRIRPRVGAMA